MSCRCSNGSSRPNPCVRPVERNDMATPTALQEERVPLASRIWISLADASVAILQSLVAAGALTYYFVNIRGLSTSYTGTVWLLFGLWNAVNDPLFGYISDRTRSKLGRRIPY
ncbi:MAG: hypothetical protein FJZ97_12835, partial [Chloroflexi bacterium]|nr:hypothetical protein [Chloroflexota bacterium]